MIHCSSMIVTHLLALLMVTGTSSAKEPALSKGHQVLLDKGIQTMGMVSKDDPFNLTTYKNANFTAVNWLWESNVSALGEPPGFAWTRWIKDPSDMLSFHPNEMPYVSSLVGLQLCDEQNLNDQAVRDQMAQWFPLAQKAHPRIMLFANSYGGQLTNPNLEAFITTSHPDMLSFDTYPFTRSGPPYGSPTNLYGDLQRYRKFALAHGVPYGIYTQTYHDADSRDPSESEMRLHYFAGLAFGNTWFSCFTYNTGASSLFTGPGDQNPKPAYGQLAEINRRIRNMGPAMTRLVNTDIRFINGRHKDPEAGASLKNPTPIDVLNWEFNANDPWMRGWIVTNLGTKNDGLEGDVLLSWFKPLDESFDGPTYSKQVYFMVTNALTAPDGSASDCRQEVKLNFFFGTSGITSVMRLNPDTGKAERIELAIIPNSGGRRQLTLELDGGTGELFKFDTGAPFVGMDALAVGQ